MAPTLFVGDSLIAYYDWQARFPELHCVNLGLPGDSVAGCLARLPGIVRRQPGAEQVVLMIGTNNMVNSDYAFVGLYERLLDELHHAYAGAGVVVCSLLPLQLPWLAPDTADRLNDHLKALAKPDWAVYLDICASFQAAETSSCFLEDGVHLSDEGYRRWSAVLADRLALPG